MLVPPTTKKIEVVCPICKNRDLIGIPQKSINKSSHLTTISIHKGLICPHHFQFFIDKNLQIRGYQKVDFELNNNNSKKLTNGIKAFNDNGMKDNTPLFQNFHRKEEIIEQKEITLIQRKKDAEMYQKKQSQKKKKSLKEIYDEFWEFIEEDNNLFEDFILNDKRRENSPLHSNTYDFYNQSKELINS
jgi:hypothetical protein